MADKITKLSQAIRLGATFRPEARQCFFDGKCGCAIYAAGEAVGYNPEGTDESFSALGRGIDLILFLAGRFETSPSFISSISARHFATGETREQIADWLESQGL